MDLQLNVKMTLSVSEVVNHCHFQPNSVSSNRLPPILCVWHGKARVAAGPDRDRAGLQVKSGRIRLREFSTVGLLHVVVVERDRGRPRVDYGT